VKSDKNKLIQEFGSFLEQNGFRLRLCEGPDRRSFGNRLIEYRNGSMGARIEVDRQQYDIRLADFSTQPSDWYPIYLIRDMFFGRGDDMTFRSQIEFAIANWEKIINRFDEVNRSNTSECLRKLRREQAKEMHPTLRKYIEQEEAKNSKRSGIKDKRVK
jgi:hypothetical protein